MLSAKDLKVKVLRLEMEKSTKYLAYYALAFSVFTRACNHPPVNNYRKSISGTYVFTLNSHVVVYPPLSYFVIDVEIDTLVIRPIGTTSGNMFEVTQSVTSVHLETGLRKQFPKIVYQSKYDPPTRSIRVRVGTEMVKMTFNPATRSAKVGMISAKKLSRL